MTDTAADPDDWSTRLLLIRHGQSQVQADSVVGGMKTCSGLSDRGRRQVGALHDRWAAFDAPPAEVLWSSPMPRALETAEIVQPSLAVGEIKVDDELEEWRPGDIDGMTWDEVRETHGPWDPRLENPFEARYGGDNRSGFRHRTGAALVRIGMAEKGKTVAIACHGGVIGSAMALAFGVGVMTPLVDMPTINSSVTELELQSTAAGLSWRVHRYNDAAHLEGLPGEE